MANQKKKTGKVIFNWVFRSIIFILFCCILLYILIQLPKVQLFVANQFTSHLSQKLKAKVKIGQVNLRFFDLAELKDLYIQDQNGDTLFIADDLIVDIAFFSLFKKKAIIEDITVNGLILSTSELKSDATYNYTFILDAFSSTTKHDDLASSSSDWDITFRKINLNKFQYRQKSRSGDDTRIMGGHLSLFIESLDLEYKIVEIRSMNFEDLNINIQTQNSESFTGTNIQNSEQLLSIIPQTTWSINIKKIQGDNNTISIKEGNKKAIKGIINYQNLKLTEFNIDLDDFVLNDQNLKGLIKNISFNEQSGFQLNKMSANVSIGISETKINDLSIITPHSFIQNNLILKYPESKNLEALLDNLTIESNFQNSALVMSDFELLLPSISTYLNIGLHDKITFKGIVNGTRSNILLSGLDIQIGKYLAVKGNIRAHNIDNIDITTFDLELNKMSTSHQKLKKVLNNIELPDELEHIGDFTLRSSIEGSLKKINIKRLQLTSSSEISLSATGTINDIDQKEKLSFDLDIEDSFANIEKLKPIYEDSTYAILHRAKELTYKGHISGDLYDITSKGAFTTPLGTITSDLIIKFENDYSSGSYVGNITFTDFDAGSALAQSNLEKVTLDMSVNGSGWTLTTLQANVNADIKKLIYNQHAYNNLNYTGNISDRLFSGKLSISEKHINSILEGTVDLRDSILKIDAEVVVNSVNLKELNLIEQPLKASFKSSIQLIGNDIDGITGKVLIKELLLDNDSIQYRTDSMTVIVNQEESKNKSASFSSNFMDADITGHFIFRNIPEIIRNHFNEVIPIEWQKEEFSNTLEHKKEIYYQDSFKLEATLKDYALFSVLGINQMPGAKKAYIELIVDPLQNEVSLNGSVDHLDYNNFSSDIIIVNSKSRGTDNQTNINAINATYKSGQIPYASITGIVVDEGIDYTFALSKDSANHFLKGEGRLIKRENQYQLAIHDPLIIYDEIWKVHDQNEISWGDERLFVRNLKLENQGKSIFINSLLNANNQQSVNEDMSIQFDDFPIEYITHSIQNVIGKVSGNVNGRILLKEFSSIPSFEAELSISDLVAENVPLGDVNIIAKDQSNPNYISIQSQLTGLNNTIKAEGTLNTNTGILNIETSIEQLSLSSLDPFLKGIINDSKGQIKGTMNILGPFDNPTFEGALTLQNIETDIEYTKMRYFIDDQQITFTENEIDIGQLKVLDNEKRTATLSGKLIHSNYKNFELDLFLTTEEFKFLNTTHVDNDLFYGKLFLKADGTLKGPANLPVANINAKTLDSTILYLSPFSDLDININDDFVIFTSPEEFKAGVHLENKNTSTFPLFLSLNLELKDNAEFQFIVDPESGDKLICRGESNLTISAKPPGTLEIYGNYIITSGQYNFSYSEFLKKHFVTEKGSTVTFNGDPNNAIFNAKAIYSTQTSIYELLKNETTLSAAELAIARRKTPIDVALKLNGQLKSPEIQFEISLPQSSTGPLDEMLSAKLQNLNDNPGELNNQVFGLLLFNSFMLSGGSSDGGNSSLTKTGTSQALSSVSKLFTYQLNKIAEKLIKGVEVNFDIDSYQTEEQKDLSSSVVTTVGVGVSKQLMGDRLRIQATGNVDFEDVDQSNRYSSVVGNFVLEYKLTENGQYLLRVYRRDNSDTFTGERSSKNGVGIMFKKSFDDRSN